METLFFKENHVIRLAFGIISVIALLLLFVFLQSFVLIIIPVIICVELFNENKLQKIRDYLKQEKVNYHTDYDNLPDKNYWLIRDCLLLSFPKKYVGIIAGKYDYSIIEPIIIQHVQTVLQVNLALDLNVLKKILVVLFYIFIFAGPIALFLAYR